MNMRSSICLTINRRYCRIWYQGISVKLGNVFFILKPKVSISTTESVRRLTKWIAWSSMLIFKQKLLDTASFANSRRLLATISCVKYIEALPISIIARNFQILNVNWFISSTWSSFLARYSIGNFQLNFGAVFNSSSWLYYHISTFDLHRVYEMICIWIFLDTTTLIFSYKVSWGSSFRFNLQSTLGCLFDPFE